MNFISAYVMEANMQVFFIVFILCLTLTSCGTAPPPVYDDAVFKAALLADGNLVRNGEFGVTPDYVRYIYYVHVASENNDDAQLNSCFITAVKKLKSLQDRPSVKYYSIVICDKSLFDKENLDKQYVAGIIVQSNLFDLQLLSAPKNIDKKPVHVIQNKAIWSIEEKHLLSNKYLTTVR